MSHISFRKTASVYLNAVCEFTMAIGILKIPKI